MHGSKRIRFVWLLVVFCSSHVQAQSERDEAASASNAPSFERVLIDQAIKDLRVFEEGSTDPAQSHVVMRWPNNVRGTKDGATVVLTSGGRPIAACCIYTWQGNELHYGFGSLSTKPVTAEVSGKAAWHPREAGVEFQRMPDAREPATTAVGRLRQMRQLSRRFNSRYYKNPTTYEDLRLIPKPVYRYELGQPRADSEIFDGAMFAFAQGTDPESLLMIEARRTPNGTHWQYATAKRTVGRIDFRLDGTILRSHKWGGWNKFQADETFSTLRLPIQRTDLERQTDP